MFASVVRVAIQQDLHCTGTGTKTSRSFTPPQPCIISTNLQTDLPSFLPSVSLSLFFLSYLFICLYTHTHTHTHTHPTLESKGLARPPVLALAGSSAMSHCPCPFPRVIGKTMEGGTCDAPGTARRHTINYHFRPCLILDLGTFELNNSKKLIFT